MKVWQQNCVCSVYLKLHVATPAVGISDLLGVLFWRSYLVELHVEVYLHQRIWYLFFFLMVLFRYVVMECRREKDVYFSTFNQIFSFIVCQTHNQNVGYVVYKLKVCCKLCDINISTHQTNGIMQSHHQAICCNWRAYFF